MSTTVTTKRNYRNEIEAVSYIDTKKEGYKLRVSTWKGGRCVCTNVTAMKIEGNAESFVMFQDYSKNIPYPELKRATEKAIIEAQTKSLAQIEVIMQEFNKHYSLPTESAS
jgi:hypothetical protein